MSKGRKKLGAAEAEAIFREYYDSTLVAPSPEQVMLEAMPFDERVNYIKTKGEEAGLIFPDVLDELKQRLLTTDPLTLLAALVFNLVTSGGGEQQWEGEDSLHKYHVELLQGLILQHDRSDFSSRNDAVEEAVNINFIVDGIKLVAKLFPARSDATLDASLGEKERGERRLSEEMRIQTQAVRNWGTLPQVMRITTSLFAPLEERISKATGVEIAGLLMMYQSLTPLVDQRILRHSDGLNSIFAADTLDDAIRRFGAAFPHFKTDVGEFSRFAASVSYNLNAFKQVLVAKAGGALPDLFTFTLRDFVDAYPGAVEPEALRRILDGSWASSFGDLRGVPVEDIFLENPVWESPLIRIGEDIYFCPALWLFVSFCVELMEKVVKIDPKLHNKYESKYKGDFLELETERLFREAFPSAKISCGSMGHVKTHGEELENDLIAVLDSCALVVEAKAHKVTPPGRRGRPDRLKTKVKELIVNPSWQGANFVNYLERHPGVTRFPSKRGGVNEIDSAPISEYVRLNVTLESLGTLSTFTPKLRAAGLVQAGADIAPTLSLSDLETVFEILEGACEKVHYFMRRAQADHSENYVGDEMDLLYAYLATGLNFERQRGRLKMQDEDYLLLLMNSRHLNPYLLRHMSKHPVPKPRRLLTRWWREIIRHLEKQKTPRWVEAGCLLLNADIEDQVDFEASFNFLSKEVRKARRARNVLKLRQGIVRTFGDAGGRDAAVAFAYKKLAPEQLDMMRRKAMRIALDHTGSGRAVIIGVDVDRDDVPFSHLDYLSRDR